MQALHSRMGGNPFGPAGKECSRETRVTFVSDCFPLCFFFSGTGKTETVKALAAQLGRFCLVFNCDESFDFQVTDSCG